MSRNENDNARREDSRRLQESSRDTGTERDSTSSSNWDKRFDSYLRSRPGNSKR